MTGLLRVFAGIDPGAKGAIALLDEGGGLVVVEDLPMRKTLVGKRARSILDECELARWIDAVTSTHWIVRAAVERQQAMPRDGAMQAFALGRNYGALRMAFAAHFIGVEDVAWRRWRSACALPVQAIDTATRKAQSIARASDLWPQHAASFKGRDGVAEAALIALWGLRCGGGGHGR